MPFKYFVCHSNIDNLFKYFFGIFLSSILIFLSNLAWNDHFLNFSLFQQPLYVNIATVLIWVNRVRTDLEKSLNLTLVLENSWNLKKKVPFVLEFCKIILETMN